MKRFDVLSRDCSIQRNCFLMASAGTGKTFCIENLVVRFLLERPKDSELPPPKIEEILAVTFTRAATAELKLRIRDNIAHCLELLEGKEGEAPDFLLGVMAEGEEAVVTARRNLREALFAFDDAQIFTIHGFCNRLLKDFTLEGDLPLQQEDSKQPILLQAEGIARDILQRGLKEEVLSEGQFAQLLKHFRSDPSALIQHFAKLLLQPKEFENLPGYQSLLEEFRQGMEACLQASITEEKIWGTFDAWAPSFKGLANRSGEIKPEIREGMEGFARLFSQRSWSSEDFDALLNGGIPLLQFFQEKNLKAKKPFPAEPFPGLVHHLIAYLKEPVEQAGDVNFILCKAARDVQRLGKKLLQSSDSLGPDDLLQKVLTSLRHPTLRDQVRSRYRVVVVDEFQDTDPIQWEIFNRLFLEGQAVGPFMYLVGDPKQSIYAFRNADVYTYLKASEALGEGNQATLQKNFRSHPDLVSALNYLFSENNCPGFFDLAFQEKALPFKPVESREMPNSLASDKGRLHIFVGEESDSRSKSFPSSKVEGEIFLPFIAREIGDLWQEQNLRLSSCAILVRDRFQGQRVKEYLDRVGIPAISRRNRPLGESSILLDLWATIQAALNPSKLSYVKESLGSQLFAWTCSQLKAFEGMAASSEVLGTFKFLGEALRTRGFALFFQKLLRTNLSSNLSVEERMLQEPGGEELLDELQQLGEYLGAKNLPYQDLEREFSYLLNEGLRDERARLRQAADDEAVQILTIHTSKGLEFEVVFALGLVSRYLGKQGYASLPGDDKLHPYNVKDPQFQAVLRDLDGEKARQFYVALTRAKFRLYLPLLKAPKSAAVPLGSASPMDLFTARFFQPQSSLEEVYERIGKADPAAFFESLQSTAQNLSISWAHLDKASPPRITPPYKEKARIIAPHQSFLPHPPAYVHSFSSLARPHGEAPEEQAPRAFDVEEKSMHTLPAGPETGIFLHSLFEKIPFSLARDELALTEAIQGQCMGGPFAAWVPCLLEMFQRVVFAPLPGKTGEFSLVDLQQEKVRMELKFFFPAQSAKLASIEEISLEPGFITGFIDLVFEHEGFFYLLDWKSNFLGSRPDSYSEDKLKGAMEAHDYGLQAALYAEALRRYLRIFSLDPDLCFGGAYYLFLRGLPDGGVLSFQPDLARLNQLFPELQSYSEEDFLCRA